MKRLITGAALATLLGLTTVTNAGPEWTNKRPDAEMRMELDDGFRCSTGSPTTLVVGLAALGLLLRRRR